MVADNLETFLDRTRTDEHELPTHVEHKLRRHTECGVLAHEFVRLRCDDCAKSRAVASVQGLVAKGGRDGRIVRRVLSDPAAAVRTSALCFASRGFSLHAATRIAANDKAGLERLCRYVARPPLAAGRGGGYQRRHPITV